MFDSLDSLFTLNHVSAVQAVLKAINNRKYLYFVTLKLDYTVLKEQERAAEEEKGQSVQVTIDQYITVCDPY